MGKNQCRLRLNWNSLNEHNFLRQNVLALPLNLQLCNKYSELRNDTIFGRILPVTIDKKLLLFGSFFLNVKQNRNIFFYCSKIILKTKRLSN